MMFYIYNDDDGNWRWRLVTANDRLLAESPVAYPRKDDCRAMIQLIRGCGLARVHEIHSNMVGVALPGGTV